MSMLYNQEETISIVNKREKFKLGSLSHIHCCISTMIFNNSDQQQDFQDFFNISYLIIDFDKLESNMSILDRRQTKKSLDFGFAIEETGEKFIVLGDFKLNRTSVKNPYKDLEDKFNNSREYAIRFIEKIYHKVYIVYPESMLEEVKQISVNHKNRRHLETDSLSLDKFEFVSIRELKEQFFN